MMNKYEKMMQELQREFDEEFSKYSEKLNDLNNKANAACCKYNDKIHAINSLRQFLQNEIRELYGFLKRFGDMGKKITPFDFVTENSRYVNNQTVTGSLSTESEYKTSGFVKTATAVSVVLAPMALPAIWIGDAWRHRKKSKEAYAEMVTDFESQKTKWERDLNKKRAEICFLESATEIANLYRALIDTVRIAIKETIVPELAGIDAFLVADAIKNAIISDLNPEDAEILPISVYQGSAYDTHYTFVENAFDYYTLIVKFFTEPILTNIVADNKVTAAEKREFEQNKREIDQQTKNLEEIAAFGGVM